MIYDYIRRAIGMILQSYAHSNGNAIDGCDCVKLVAYLYVADGGRAGIDWALEHRHEVQCQELHWIFYAAQMFLPDAVEETIKDKEFFKSFLNKYRPTPEEMLRLRPPVDMDAFRREVGPREIRFG